MSQPDNLGVGSDTKVTEWFQQQLLAALADPLFNVPKQFETWVVDRVAVSGLNIPIGQIVGFSGFTAQFDNVVAEAHTTSNVYADASVSGGAGPELDGLADGQYVLFFGGSGGGDFATNTTYHIAASVNGSTPTDDQSAEFASDRGNTSGAMIVIATLNNDGNNNVKCVYRSSDGTDRGNIRYRWLVALKFANA